jgi:hypothetical protein
MTTVRMVAGAVGVQVRETDVLDAVDDGALAAVVRGIGGPAEPGVDLAVRHAFGRRGQVAAAGGVEDAVAVVVVLEGLAMASNG